MIHYTIFMHIIYVSELFIQLYIFNRIIINNYLFYLQKIKKLILFYIIIFYSRIPQFELKILRYLFVNHGIDKCKSLIKKL